MTFGRPSFASILVADSCSPLSGLILPHHSWGGQRYTYKVDESQTTRALAQLHTHAQRQENCPSTVTVLRAAAGPVRAAVFVKHRVTPAPERQPSFLSTSTQTHSK